MEKEETIVNIFCGFRQSFFISSHNRIYCSGYNKFGELGIPNKSDNFCYFFPQCNEEFTGKNTQIVKIETGQKFTCLLDCKFDNKKNSILFF